MTGRAFLVEGAFPVLEKFSRTFLSAKVVRTLFAQSLTLLPPTLLNMVEDMVVEGMVFWGMVGNDQIIGA